jgi:SNF2 family DNA or RNA helicase
MDSWSGMKKLRLIKEPITIPKHNAFPYQQEAVTSIRDLEYAAIFHEQGLGKTKIAIDILLYWLEKTTIDTVLIVTKKQLIHNWKQEFESHTFIKPEVLNSDRLNNHYVLRSPSRVIIANFEVLLFEKGQITSFLKARNVAIIIDESAKLKNPESKLTKTYHELSQQFHRRVIMTGTPVANRPYDIWSQIYFLDHGKSLGDDFSSFRKSIDLSNKLSGSIEMQNMFEQELSSLFKRISSFTVRETKNSAVVTLPDKVFYRESVELADTQKLLYDKIRNDLQVEVKKKGNLIIDDSTALVKRLLRLVQVASNPGLVDESYNEVSVKELALEKLIRHIVTKDEKCIVWSNFIENINKFQNRYTEYGAVKIHGGMKIVERNRSVEKFRLPEYRIIFATPASAKEGLTLTEANHVIFYDRSFSLDDYLQAQDRIHRISQQKTCYIYNIIASETIDEWIDILLSAKQNAAALAQGDISFDEYKLNADYSFGDIIKEILNINDELEEGFIE